MSEEAMTVEEKTAAAYLQAAFDETGLNGTAINWRYWVEQMPTLSAAQAACLMAALEPDRFATLCERPGKDDPSRNIEKARKIQGLAESQGKLMSSPAEWMGWAQALRINVHIGFLLAVWELPTDSGKGGDAPKVGTGDTVAIEEPEIKNWILLIQAEAARRWKLLRDTGANPTKNNIKDDLAAWCREAKVKTDGDINPSGDYIYRHVLSKWTPPRV